MNDGYGKLFLMLLAIGLIFLAASGRGRAVWSALTTGAAYVASPAPASASGSGTPAPSNPTDLRVPGNNLGSTDLGGSAIG